MGGKKVLTTFHGMELTTDKLRSMIKKNQTYIHAHTDVKTTDGFHLRVFCIGFTERGVGQVKKTAYAKSKQVKRIRKKMIAIMQREIKRRSKGPCEQTDP